MTDFTDKPLPEDFYDAPGWLESLIQFYCVQQNKFGPRTLEEPLTKLTNAIETIIGAYGNSSYVMVDAFEKTINPLYEQGEYKDGVYDVLKSAGNQRTDPRLHRYAESLMYIRRLFEQDKAFLTANFQNQIATIVGNDDITVKLDNFADTLRKITKTHIQQVIGMIKEL